MSNVSHGITGNEFSNNIQPTVNGVVRPLNTTMPMTVKCLDDTQSDNTPKMSSSNDVGSDSCNFYRRRLHSMRSSAIVDKPVSPFRRTAGTNREGFLATIRKGVFGVPRIGIVTRRHSRKNKFVNFIGEFHLDLVQHFGAAPIIIPRTEYTAEHLQAYMPLDGLVIVEGEDIGPEYNPYGYTLRRGFEYSTTAQGAQDNCVPSFPNIPDARDTCCCC
eukprot:Lankesteria_metandrocarpae@DN3519_c0_g1_i1.p1